MKFIHIKRESGIDEYINVDLIRRIEMVPPNEAEEATVRVFFDDNHRVNFTAAEANSLLSRLMNEAGVIR